MNERTLIAEPRFIYIYIYMTTSNGLSNHLRTIMKKIIKKKKKLMMICVVLKVAIIILELYFLSTCRFS